MWETLQRFSMSYMVFLVLQHSAAVSFSPSTALKVVVIEK